MKKALPYIIGLIVAGLLIWTFTRPEVDEETIMLSGTAPNFGGAYNGLIDQEVVTFGIRVPIAGFGKARSRIEVARSNLELKRLNISQEKIGFERRVQLQVKRFELLRNQVDLAERASDVALRREAITRKRYLIGKISITELQLAVRKMDEARRQYVFGLQYFWLGVYELRRLTLYDFITGERLSAVRKN